MTNKPEPDVINEEIVTNNTLLDKDFLEIIDAKGINNLERVLYAGLAFLRFGSINVGDPSVNIERTREAISTILYLDMEDKIKLRKQFEKDLEDFKKGEYVITVMMVLFVSGIMSLHPDSSGEKYSTDKGITEERLKDFFKRIKIEEEGYYIDFDKIRKPIGIYDKHGKLESEIETKPILYPYNVLVEKFREYLSNDVLLWLRQKENYVIQLFDESVNDSLSTPKNRDKPEDISYYYREFYLLEFNDLLDRYRNNSLFVPEEIMIVLKLYYQDNNRFAYSQYDVDLSEDSDSIICSFRGNNPETIKITFDELVHWYKEIILNKG